MLKTFPIDFVRQILEQKLLEEHIKDVNLFGGKEQVAITSFYEQLKSQDEVDRFIETYRDLTEQQNRTGLILNGVLLSPENPTITNLYSSLIVPMDWTCSLRCTLANRDNGIITINNLIEKLKGRKVDIAQLNCVDDNGKPYSTPFCVGTIGQGNGQPSLKNGDYIGELESANDLDDVVGELNDEVVSIEEGTYWFYCKNGNKLKVVAFIETGTQNIVSSIDNNYTLNNNRYITFDVYATGLWQLGGTKSILGTFDIVGDTTEILTDISGNIDSWSWNNGQTKFTLTFDLGQNVNNIVSNFTSITIEDASINIPKSTPQFLTDDGTHQDIIFPQEHTSFEQYKVSLSFDAIRCDEPRNLNEKEYCELSFGGNATLVSKGVQLGNDLLKIGITKLGYQAESYVSFSNAPTYFLEPLEMPSGNNANTEINQLVSNNFLSNTHSDAIALTLQYTFICDRDIDLINQWFNYARYGTRGLTVNDITPNLEYKIVEYWCSWGNFENKEIKTKIVENIDIENTESDTLTISLTMQIQGENN